MPLWINEEEKQMCEFLEEILTQNGVEIDEDRFEWVGELNEEMSDLEDHLYYWTDNDDYYEAYVAYTPNLVIFFDSKNDERYKEWRR